MIRIHCLQHVPFEGPAHIADWAREQRAQFDVTPLWHSARLPVLRNFDWLVVMGGPMSVGDEGLYHWLHKEKALIAAAIAARKVVLGVCLGAQLIAEVLGSRVYPNRHKEIGCFPVNLTSAGQTSPVLRGLPETFTPLHWHGDTFDLPPDSQHLALSEACLHQAFAYKKHVLALQFHLETSEPHVYRLMQNCPAELQQNGAYIQTPQKLLSAAQSAVENRAILFRMLNNLSAYNEAP